MKECELQSLLNEMRGKHGVVGASLSVLREGTIETCASGLLNANTRVECTADSVFQIGSISKLFTATLIMQLIEQGRLKLDDPVSEHLPEFTLADPAAVRAVTVRQLLNHTSGIDGDFFPADDPEGASTVSYVRKMCLLTNLYAPGEGPVTYSNSGFVVAGRIVEVLTGMTWQRAVIERICKPLGMPEAFAHPEQSLRFRCAIGHVPDPKHPDSAVPCSEPFLPISMASAGSVLSMSAESLLLFAKAHMAGGESSISQILGSESARRMRDEKTPLPPWSRSGITHWGLGWFLGEAPDYRMAGHDGGTQGQFAYLRAFPERKIAFTLLTNSLSDKMFREIERHLMQSLLGASIPADLPAEPFEPQADRYVGRYRNAAASYVVSEERGKLGLHYAASLGAIREFRATLEPYRHDVFAIQASDSPFDGQKVGFLGGQDGEDAAYIRLGIRMGRRDANST